MEILHKRKFLTLKSTISTVFVNGEYECYFLEDVDRGLTQVMSLSEIMAKKVKGQTAIPKGRYEVVVSFSERFQKYLPLLIAVPGFEGIRIHPGNTSVDTEGCLLPGTEKGNDVVLNSKVAFEKLFSKIKSVEKKEKIFITIS